MDIPGLWRLYTCPEPAFIELVDAAVRRKKQMFQEARNA